MKLYKLMRPDHTTREWQKWKLGVRVEKAPCDNPQLCSSDVLHAYTNLNLAFLLTYLHNTYAYTVVAECDGNVVVSDWAKVGCIAITPKRWIDKPTWVGSEHDRQVRVMFGVICAEAVIDIYNAEYPSDNRPQRAIEAAKTWLASSSKETGARATYAARDASAAAYAARAADAAAYAARAADAAASAAAYAARAAGARTMGAAAAAASAAASYAAYAARAAGARTIDFAALANKAVRMVCDTEPSPRVGEEERG